MKHIKIPKKLVIIVILITIVSVLLVNSTIGRYIYNSLNNHLLESQNFYFDSSILTINSNTYSVSNWDGVNPYVLTIDVNSKKNDLISTNVDVKYDIFVSCPNTVLCTVNKEKGIISRNNKTDSYIITVTPLNNFYEGNTVTISTSATSTYPYTKTLSANYIIGVENYGFSYDIEDSSGAKYLTLELTNSKPYYEVIEAFDDYAIGDHVSLNDYNDLPNNKKAYCVSHRVTVGFDPNILSLDLTDNVYIDNISYQTTSINGYNYINSITFDVPAIYNEQINFYKKNVSMNYNLNNSSITVNVDN